MREVPAREGIIASERQLGDRVIPVRGEQAPRPRPAPLPSAFDELDPYREPSSRTSPSHGPFPSNRDLSSHVHARPGHLNVGHRSNAYQRSISSPRVCLGDAVRSPPSRPACLFGWSRPCLSSGVFSSLAPNSCSKRRVASANPCL